MHAGSAPFWIEENKQHEIPKFFSDRRRHHHGGGGWRGNAVTEIIVSGRTAAQAIEADNQ